MRAHLKRFWLLYAIVLAGAVLRFVGIGFAHGIPKARPDEELFVQQALFLFSGDMNPHWAANGWPELYFFLIHFALRLKLWWLELVHGAPVNLGCLYALDPAQISVPARMVSWFFGVLTLPLTYFFARSVHREGRDDGFDHFAGIAAVAMMAFNVLHTRDSHFAVSDTAVVFFMTLGLWQLTRAIDGTSVRPLFYAAFAFGVGSSIKYTGLVMVGMLGLATLERFFRTSAGPHRRRMFVVAVGVLLTFALGFALVSPHVFVEPEAFKEGLLSHQVRYSEGGATWGYDPDRPLVRGIVYHGLVSVPEAIGWPLALLALAGTALGLWKGRGGAFYAAFFSAFFYVMVLGPSTILFTRYTLPLYPALSVLAVSVPIALLRARRIGASDPRVRWAGPVVLSLALVLPAITSVQLVTRMTREDTRDQALAWLHEHTTEEDLVRTESAFASVPSHDGELVQACRAALPEALRRPAVRWSSGAGARHRALVDQGPAGWGPLAKSFLEHSSDLGSPTRAAYVVQSLPQLTCGREVPYGRLSPLPSCFREVARFTPGESDCETRYDTFDMFMQPLARPAGVVRPGPTVVIHENACGEGR